MPAAAERQEQVIRYTPRPSTAPDERDLILLEQEEWGKYCGILTRANLVRYLRSMFFEEQKSDDELANEVRVDCCGYGDDLAIPLYVYELREGVSYDLRATAGRLGRGVLETVYEKESLTFNLNAEATIRHPAARIVSARWLTGPWTTGGADVAPPTLTLDGRTARSPIPLFGTVELLLAVRRWRHILTIPQDEAEELLINGWAEFAVGLPGGGRPVGVEVAPPPGAAELAKTGAECGRGRGGDSGHVSGPDDDGEPTASPENKHIRCDYCGLECEGDKEGDE